MFENAGLAAGASPSRVLLMRADERRCWNSSHTLRSRPCSCSAVAGSACGNIRGAHTHTRAHTHTHGHNTTGQLERAALRAKQIEVNANV